MPSAKEEFIQIYRANITRPGAEELLDYLEHKSDFFIAPSSARFHGSYEGGLCEHSVNVYHCLVDYLARERDGVLGGDGGHCGAAPRSVQDRLL